MSNATGKNDSVKSNPGTCMYPLTKIFNFRRINPSAYSLFLSTYLIDPGFMTLGFMMLLFFGIHAFLDRKSFTSEIMDIFH